MQYSLPDNTVLFPLQFLIGLCLSLVPVRGCECSYFLHHIYTSWLITEPSHFTSPWKRSYYIGPKHCVCFTRLHKVTEQHNVEGSELKYRHTRTFLCVYTRVRVCKEQHDGALRPGPYIDLRVTILRSSVIVCSPYSHSHNLANIQNTYRTSLPYGIVMIIMSRKMRWAEHIARTEENRSV
jgi:hypothetical protein